MTQRNFVVREMLNNPKRNGGKHIDKRERVLSTATMKEFDMQADKPEIDLRAEVVAVKPVGNSDFKRTVARYSHI